jgi:hypothetical protein
MRKRNSNYEVDPDVPPEPADEPDAPPDLSRAAEESSTASAWVEPPAEKAAPAFPGPGSIPDVSPSSSFAAAPAEPSSEASVKHSPSVLRGAEGPVVQAEDFCPLPEPVADEVAEAQERLRARLAEEIHNPRGASRQLVIFPAVAILVLAGGGFLGVRLFFATTSQSEPALEVVKTAAQERAEEEVAQRRLEPFMESPQLALVEAVPSAPMAASLPSRAASPAPGRATAPAARPARALRATAVVTEPEEPAPQPVVRRSLATSMATRFADVPAAPSASAALVPRGTFLSACLTSPADPNTPAPFTAQVSADVRIGGRIAVPKHSTLVCGTQGLTGARVGATCDTLNMPEGGAVSFSGLVYGRDRRPGLPTPVSGGAGAAQEAKESALSTAERLAGRLTPGGIAGELSQAALGAGGGAARRSLRSSEVGAAPVPRNTCFLVFVEHLL